MLRAFFNSMSRAAWAQRTITNWGFAWRTASRFVAGETIQEAVIVLDELNRKGISGSLDHLGENTTSPQEADRAADEVLELLRAIARPDIHASASIKLSQIGLLLNEELCQNNLLKILESARDQEEFIRLDMEDSSMTQATLDMYVWARRQGFDNLGVVIQAYLYRSEADLKMLGEIGARVRLCKGAYREPPNVAFPRKQDVDANYDHLAELLMKNALAEGAPKIDVDGKFPPIPAIATHDPQRIRFAQATAERLGLPKEAVEYQMLYGIRRDLQESLAAKGYPVRVYIPYGTHWYPYLMRRLAERPANLWFFLSSFFHR
jgi:proline dehydrogenase